MPEFPEKIFTDILSRFGIDNPADIEPWPYLEQSDDLVAGFELDGQRLLLKRRHIEQRGERSLFETHFALKELIKLGLPAPELWSSPSGETLIPGVDWEEDKKAYYEIQHHVEGDPYLIELDSAYDAGIFLAGFHRLGDQVDTYLLGKHHWTDTFIHRRFRWFDPIVEKLNARTDVPSVDRQTILDRMHRHRDIVWRKGLTWRLVHGNLCANNLLRNGDGFCLIDFEEIGRSEVDGETIDLLLDLAEFDQPITEKLLRGYQAGGGELTQTDLTSIQDILIISRLHCLLGENAENIDIPSLIARFDFLLDC